MEETLEAAHRLYEYLLSTFEAPGDPAEYRRLRHALVQLLPQDVPACVRESATLDDFAFYFRRQFKDKPLKHIVRKQFRELFEKLEQTSRPTRTIASRSVGIFISHASRDGAVAKALADLFRDALSLSAGAIRCTTIDEYALDAGAETDDALREEIASSAVFVAILTLASLRSHYVLFELGARWGSDRPHFLPLVAGALEPKMIPQPLSARNARDLRSVADIHRVLKNVAGALDRPLEDASSYANAIDELRTLARELPERRINEFPVGALRVVRALLNEPDGRFLSAERRNYSTEVDGLIKAGLVREANERLFLSDEGKQLALDYLQSILLRG